MGMRVELQSLVPGMQHTEEADLRAQMTWVTDNPPSLSPKLVGSHQSRLRNTRKRPRRSGFVQVGIATGISDARAGLGSEEAPEACGVLQYLSSRAQLQYLPSDTRRTSESDPKSSPQSV